MKIPKQKPKIELLYGGDDYSDLEQRLKAVNARYQLQEVGLTFKGDKYYFGDIKSVNDIYQFILKNILEYVDVQEVFIALYVNDQNRIVGYYHHSTGTSAHAQVDFKLITACAIKTLATGVIIAHNHPDGIALPSDADKRVTRKLKEALAFFNIRLIDHLIITKGNKYYSFLMSKESSLKGIGELPQDDTLQEKITQLVDTELSKLTPANSPVLYAMTQQPGGKEQVTEMVIRKMIADHLIPQAAIPQLESDLNMM